MFEKTMTPVPSPEEDDDDDDTWEEEMTPDFGDFLNEDQWEDNIKFQALKANMPKDWTMIKVVNYTFRNMREMDDWLTSQCKSPYEKVGFRSNCAYNVAVQFSDVVDAVMFKMRWR